MFDRLNVRAAADTWRLAALFVVVSVTALLALANAAGAATTSGVLYGFGANGYGELGNATSSSSKPNPVTLRGERGSVKQIAIGSGYSLVLSTSSQLYAFGSNVFGQLGNRTYAGTNRSNPRPALVRLPGRVGTITEIAAGEGHSLALTSSGQLYAWGKNDDGEVGIFVNNGNFRPDWTPRVVRLPGRVGAIRQISAGNDFTLALTASGQLFSFGQNQNGELGNTINNGFGVANPTPRQVKLPGLVGRITHISAGGVHALVATSSGQLYAFGENYYGELGNTADNGSYGANPVPTLVTLPGRVGVVTQVSAGDEHSLALTSRHQLFAFGDNQYGQLGSTFNAGTRKPNPVPKLVALRGRVGVITQINAGLTDSLVLTSSGQLFAFGDNQYGELGSAGNVGTQKPTPTPHVAKVPRGARITSIEVGSEGSHTLAFCGGCRRARG